MITDKLTHCLSAMLFMLENQTYSMIALFIFLTYVFLILLHYNSQLPNATFSHTVSDEKLHEINVQECFEIFGLQKTKEILVFLSFTGSHQTSKFNTKIKLVC